MIKPEFLILSTAAALNANTGSTLLIKVLMVCNRERLCWWGASEGILSRIVASILFEEVSPSEVAFWAYSKACFGSETMRSLDKILKCRI